MSVNIFCVGYKKKFHSKQHYKLVKMLTLHSMHFAYFVNLCSLDRTCAMQERLGECPYFTEWQARGGDSEGERWGDRCVCPDRKRGVFCHLGKESFITETSLVPAVEKASFVLCLLHRSVVIAHRNTMTTKLLTPWQQSVIITQLTLRYLCRSLWRSWTLVGTLTSKHFLHESLVHADELVRVGSVTLVALVNFT